MIVGILGVDPTLDRMPAELDVFLSEVERLARRNSDLSTDEIDARNRFRNAVLNLHPWVDFHEEEFTCCQIEQKLDRADVGVVNALGGFDGEFADALAHFFSQCNRRRLFEQFLIAALDRALALAEVNDFAEIIRHDLHFDMPRPLDVMLEVKPDFRNVDDLKNAFELVLVVRNEHRLAAAAADRFQNDGIFHVARGFESHVVVRERQTALRHWNAARRN